MSTVKQKQRKKSKQLNTVTSREFSAVFKVALFTQFGGTLSCIIDGIFVSRCLGTDAMTAYGIGAAYFPLIAIVIFALLVGGQALYTGRLGQNSIRAARGAFGLTVWVAVILGAVMTVLGIIFAEPLASVLGANGDAGYLKPLAADYIRTLFAGTAFNAFMTVTGPAVQLDGKGRLVKICGVAVCAADIIGDAASVFVFHGGLAGMGIATSAGYVVGAVIMGSYFFAPVITGKKTMFSMNPKVIDWKAGKALMNRSSSQSLFFLCTFISPVIVNNIIIACAGVDCMSSISVERNAAMFLNTFCYALGDGVFLLTGLHYGEMDRTEVRRVYETAKRYLVRLILPVSAAVIVFSGLITRIYMADPEDPTFDFTRLTMIALGISLPLETVFNIYLKQIQGVNRSLMASAAAMCQALVFPVLCSAVLALIWQDTGILISIVAMQLLAAAFAWVSMRKLRKDETLFAIDEDDILRLKLRKIRQTSIMSELVQDFCIEKGVPAKLGLRMGLCAEEISLMILEQGIKTMSEGFEPSLEFRFFVDSSKAVMIFKDNCPKLDLKAKAEQWSPESENAEQFMGARIALKMSADFSFLHTLNTNNMRITFRTGEKNR